MLCLVDMLQGDKIEYVSFDHCLVHINSKRKQDQKLRKLIHFQVETPPRSNSSGWWAVCMSVVYPRIPSLIPSHKTKGGTKNNIIKQADSFHSFRVPDTHYSSVHLRHLK